MSFLLVFCFGAAFGFVTGVLIGAAAALRSTRCREQHVDITPRVREAIQKDYEARYGRPLRVER